MGLARSIRRARRDRQDRRVSPTFSSGGSARPEGSLSAVVMKGKEAKTK